MASVGIVGGLGVGATVHYYEKITSACKARGVAPDLAIVHADVDYGQALVRDGKLGALAQYLAAFIERLRKAGATTAVLPAITPHICLGELAPRASLPILNIVVPTLAEIARRGVGKVALFGTTFTMEGGLWGLLKGVEIVKPAPDEIAFIGALYQRLLDTQAGDAGDLADLRRIAADLQRRTGVETILIAGTDFAVLFDEETAGFPAIDMARLHIAAIVERLTT
ncbi:MAG: aspartate/glutamate racemase family protein [Alphaproteobacteria bacterium]|nr:aspartate/glutamate racemase family protein [Alphaproteobacteria bacterium]